MVKLHSSKMLTLVRLQKRNLGTMRFTQTLIKRSENLREDTQHAFYQLSQRLLSTDVAPHHPPRTPYRSAPYPLHPTCPNLPLR